MGYNDIVVGRLPTINLPRSKFKMPFNHKTSFLHGDLVPIHAFECNTGDGFSLNLSAILRMSTPIVPFMDTIKCYIEAFAIPKRLVWEHWKEFNGENKGAGYQTTSYLYPACATFQSAFATTQALQRSLSYALGNPVHIWNTSNAVVGIPVSVLAERAYFEVWNTKFRASQLQPCESVDYGDGYLSGGNYRAKVLTSDTNAVDIWGHTLKKVNKMHDYFVDSTLSPQYSAPVTLPLGSTAPVGVISLAGGTVSSNTSMLTGAAMPGISSPSGYNLFIKGGTYVAGQVMPSERKEINAGTVANVGLDLVADLTNATAATVNELRYAFALQRFAERENYAGNLYRDILAVHYGVKVPDSTMQLPEHLGGFSFLVNVNQVTSQSGWNSDATTVLGEVGANSTTVISNRHVFSKSFTEPCIVIVFAYTKHKRTYSQGVPRERLKYKNKFDWLWPEFMNIGDRGTLYGEIFFDKSMSAADLNQFFGYQDSWAEDKYFNDIVTGYLNPSIPAALGAHLGQWTLADAYATKPTLSSSWIQEDRDALTRCLKTGANGPDFIADFYFDYTASKIMAIRKMPGLIDHVGLF